MPIIAPAVQAQLREIGIDASANIMNSSEIPSRHHIGTLELALVSRNVGATADPLGVLIENIASHHGSD